jgi:hypothetical protein
MLPPFAGDPRTSPEWPDLITEPIMAVLERASGTIMMPVLAFAAGELLGFYAQLESDIDCL